MKTQRSLLPSAAVLTIFSCLISGCSHKQHPPRPAQSKPLPPSSLAPLIQAAADGEPEKVRRLLDQGADVGIRSSVPHDHTALEAAIWHRQNDIERFDAVPPDAVGEGLRNQPLYSEGAAKDEDYREVIGMLRQAAKDKAAKDKAAKDSVKKSRTGTGSAGLRRKKVEPTKD